MNKELKEHLKSLEDLQDSIRDTVERSVIYQKENVGLGTKGNSSVNDVLTLGLFGVWIVLLFSFL